MINFLSIPAVRFQQESLSALNRPAVRFLQELVSAFSRNPCPLWSGIGVRIAQEQVSALHKIMHSNYKEWWLLLVDATNLGFSAEDFDQLKTVHISSDLFAKILILSSFSHLDGYEIFNRKTIG